MRPTRLPELDDFEKRSLQQRIIERLPKYRKLFEQASAPTPFRWTLISALAYQESHWNPYAISPTGVRGIMMLTLATAQDLGVKDRLDPQQSIPAGTIYLARIYKRLPATIKDPDRLWMALAAYNIGYGHLLDAMALASRRGLNPHQWKDVEAVLPLLESPRVANTLIHGGASGSQAVHFVQRVRQYWQVLHQTFEGSEPNPLLIASGEKVILPHTGPHSARTDLIFTNSWMPNIPSSRP